VREIEGGPNTGYTLLAPVVLPSTFRNNRLCDKSASTQLRVQHNGGADFQPRRYFQEGDSD